MNISIVKVTANKLVDLDKVEIWYHWVRLVKHRGSFWKKYSILEASKCSHRIEMVTQGPPPPLSWIKLMYLQKLWKIMDSSWSQDGGRHICILIQANPQISRRSAAPGNLATNSHNQRSQKEESGQNSFHVRFLREGPYHIVLTQYGKTGCGVSSLEIQNRKDVQSNLEFRNW